MRRVSLAMPQPPQRNMENCSAAAAEDIKTSGHIHPAHTARTGENIASETVGSKRATDSPLQGSFFQKNQASQGRGEGTGSWGWLGLAQKAVPAQHSVPAERATQDSVDIEAGRKEILGAVKTWKITQLVEAALQQVV